MREYSGAHALVEAPRHAEVLVDRVERIPVVRVPVVAVHQVRADERSDGAQLAHAPHELAAGEVHVVHGQHRDELQPIGAVPAELVNPVVVGLAQRERQQRIEVVPGDQPQTRSSDRARRCRRLPSPCPSPAPRGRSRARPRSRDGRCRRCASPTSGCVLCVSPRRTRFRYCWRSMSDVGCPSIDRETRWPALRPAVGSHLHGHAVPELRIEIPVEEIGRLHDVHVGVHEPETIFHASPPEDGHDRAGTIAPPAPTGQ